jgi:hypothetical protein
MRNSTGASLHEGECLAKAPVLYQESRWSFAASPHRRGNCPSRKCGLAASRLGKTPGFLPSSTFCLPRVGFRQLTETLATKRRQGDDHPDTLNTEGNLGVVRIRQGGAAHAEGAATVASVQLC